jgi:hypothetical protein
MVVLTNEALIEFVAWRYIAWGDLIRDLEKAGWTPANVARALNVAPTTLSGWCNEGKEPRYSCGEALLRLYGRVFGNEHTQKRISAFRESAIKHPATG